MARRIILYKLECDINFINKMKKKEKENKMKKIKRKEKGITLIALVVTIVVLLILAGISISILTGDNGIIGQAKKGKEQTEIEQEKEKVDLSAVFAARKDKGGRLTEENFKEELDKQIGNDKYKFTYDKENEQYVVEYLESGRTYYIEANAEPITIDMKYKIQIGKKAQYFKKLKEAYEASISGGGDDGGGTITVLRDVEETDEIKMNKDITIDTNGMKMTRKDNPLYVEGGILTIKGTGEIDCQKNDTTENSIIIVRGGELKTIDSPTIRGYNVPIKLEASPEGMLNLNGGYIIGEYRSGIEIQGSGKDVIINNTIVVSLRRGKNGLNIASGGSRNITIKGYSKIGGGMLDEPGAGASTTSMSSTISNHTTGKLTITDNAMLMAGPYSSNLIALYANTDLEISGNASLYNNRSSYLIGCNVVSNSKMNITIDTNGMICSSQKAIINNDNTYMNEVEITIKKGNFCSKDEPRIVFMGIINGVEVNGTKESIVSGAKRQNEVTYYYIDPNNLDKLIENKVQNVYTFSGNNFTYGYY